MTERDFKNQTQSDGAVPGAEHAESLRELFDSVDPTQYEFEDDENAYYHTDSQHDASLTSKIKSPDSSEAGDISDSGSPQLNLSDFTDYDTYQDSGTYRSYDGSSEYRSFDAALPEAPDEEWYHYSPEDADLDDDLYSDDIYEDNTELDETSSSHRLLHIMSHVLLLLVTLMAGFYLMVLYSGIPVLTNLRDTYIRTAMVTLSHKYLATAIIPSEIIDQVMLEDYAVDDEAVGVETDWGNIQIQALPVYQDTIDASDSSTVETEQTQETNSSDAAVETMSSDEQTFYEIFYEVDKDSFRSYLEDHPDVLDNGWSGIDINEAGLDDDGTSIETVYGDQVLALDAENGILLVRLHLDDSRGVMAICKNTSQLSLCSATTLPTVGQTAGTICDANDGILAMNGSAFLDDGTGNGGQISGLAVCEGEEMGTRLGQAGDKRLELRNDNRMYIVDSYSSLDSDTRDACEFRPALIVDGENISTSSSWTNANPRTVLGQSSRLETMMVIIEGRLSDSPGCSVVLVAEKMAEYGCVQALNLDGGTSAIMYYKGEYITRCSNTQLSGGRTLPNAWVYHSAS